MPRPDAVTQSEACTETDCEITILSFRARIDGPADLVRELRGLYPDPSPAVSSFEPSSRTRFRIGSNRSGTVHQLQRDGATFWASERRADLVPTLEWAVNTAAVERLGQTSLLFHAGSVARHGQGILLPAASGSGKSTLVAGLVAAGFEYFGDDVAVVNPSELRLAPFGKSLCVKAGSRSVLAASYPQLAHDRARRRWGDESVWYVAPPDGRWPSQPAPVRYVILPRYVPGAPTTLAPIARSVALTGLLEQSFSARRHGVGAVVGMLRGADCYRLIVGDLHQAVPLLLDLTAPSATARVS